MFSGPYPDGAARRILLPVVPEYVGYADQGLDPACFVGKRPSVEMLGERSFKYRVDLDSLQIDDSIGALSKLAHGAGVPLILDNAYGLPFPGIVFRDATPIWNEDIALYMSLSKIGLPALRSGIVIAREELVDRLSATNAIVSLATGSFGPAIAERLLRSGELLRLSREAVGPYYRAKSERALAIVAEELGDLP